jgi:hypothetical protein
MLDLKSLEVSDRILTLGTPWSGRIILFAMTGVLGCLMAVNASFSFVPGVLALVILAAAFYKEEWRFDYDRKRIDHSEGVLFVKKKKSFALVELVRVELRNSRPAPGETRQEFEPGLPDPRASAHHPEQVPSAKFRGRGFSGLFLILSDGREVNVHTTSIRKATQQDRLGRMISQVCRKPFSTYS